MDWMGIILLVLLVILVGGFATSISSSRKSKGLEDQLRNQPDFEPADVYVNSNSAAIVIDPAGIAIDPERQKIALAGSAGVRLYRPNSIVGCEVIQDDVQIAFANRGSQVAGVVAGGLLLGGVGALIGGLSGSKRSVSNVRTVTLRILTDDFDQPVHDIVLMDWPDKKGVKTNSHSYRNAIETAHRWHARVMALMKSAEADGPDNRPRDHFDAR